MPGNKKITRRRNNKNTLTSMLLHFYTTLQDLWTLSCAPFLMKISYQITKSTKNCLVILSLNSISSSFFINAETPETAIHFFWHSLVSRGWLEVLDVRMTTRILKDSTRLGFFKGAWINLIEEYNTCSLHSILVRNGFNGFSFGGNTFKSIMFHAPGVWRQACNTFTKQQGSLRLP